MEVPAQLNSKFDDMSRKMDERKEIWSGKQKKIW